VFNLTGSEIIVILLLALVILGPEKLPEAMRKAGRAYNELRKMANSFQSEVRSVIDEPMNELRGTADMLRDATDFTGTKKKPATPKPAPAGGARPAAGPPAADSAAEPPVDEPPVDEPPVDEPGVDGEADAAPAEDEHGEEDVVTRTLSGDVDAQAHADEAGPSE
jgi:sec-independent protein translocase protein TatB